MNKRTFLKTSSVLLTGSILSHLASCRQQEPSRKNWAGNYEYRARRMHLPGTVAEVQELVKSLSKLRVLGTRHSFNGIADSTENQISLQHLDQVVTSDRELQTITVEGGMRYGQLCTYLDSNSFALHNLASLPHISVAGACATATHGSGVKNGNLATAVGGLEMVTSDGEVIVLSREKDGEKFLGAVVALGGLGVVTKLTLDIQRTYSMRQDVYQNLPMQQLKDHFNEIMSAGYSVSLFTDWRSDSINQVWIKSRVEDTTDYELYGPPAAAPEFFGAVLAKKNLHPIAELSAENCTDQMGVPGPWHQRLPHFKMDFTPSSGEELQSEYFVPRQRAVEAILDIARLRDQVSPHLLISEVRTVDADNLWMSPCYKQASVAIHFTWKQNWREVRKLLPLIEETLAPFSVRPHWGKLFTMSPLRLRSLYEKLPDFKQLLNNFDPQGKFRNEFLDVNLFSGS